MVSSKLINYEFFMDSMHFDLVVRKQFLNGYSIHQTVASLGLSLNQYIFLRFFENNKKKKTKKKKTIV